MEQSCFAEETFLSTVDRFGKRSSFISIFICINSIFNSTCSMKRFTTRFKLSIVLLSLNFFSFTMGISVSSGNDMWKLHWEKCTARSSITDEMHYSWKFWDFNQFLGRFTVERASSFFLYFSPALWFYIPPEKLSEWIDLHKRDDWAIEYI